mmetsp:Transcript_1989/g.5517  ORF Transcript_1989/g.5517 Transcript_1989/m.5517 type:complete len:557 (+) Transcript_1989:162-1832(+)
MSCQHDDHHHQQQHHKQARRERQQQRQASIVRKSLAYVEADIQHVLRQSPFLQESEPGAHIALFHRSEIVTGQRLGKGGFSYVLEIVDFCLKDEYSALLQPAQRELRELYREQTRRSPGRFAVKHLQERLLQDARSFQCAASDLAVEAAYMSALDHPNILSVRGLPIHGLDSLQEGRHDSYFIVLDRLQDTLDKRISTWRRTQDMPLLGKAGYALQLAAALQYCHERNILFRDLKPQNVGFTTDGRLQLLDFGLCREMPSSPHDPNATFEMSGVGTRRYMAVEIVNSSFYNDKADVYSWAMVFWEMMALSKPYPTYSMDDHKRFVCEGGERPPLMMKNHKNDAAWPQALQNLLQHSWTTNTADRLSMKEVECLLRSYIQSCQMLEDNSNVEVVLAPESPTSVVPSEQDSLVWMDHHPGHAASHHLFPTCAGDDATVTTAATSLCGGGLLKPQPSSSSSTLALSDLEFDPENDFDEDAVRRLLRENVDDDDDKRWSRRMSLTSLGRSVTSSDDMFSVFGQSATSTAASTDLSSVGDSAVLGAFTSWSPSAMTRTSSV